MTDTPGDPMVPVEPVPVEPPTPVAVPDIDLATQIMALCEVYKPRLVAIKNGLFKPVDLVNNGWYFYPALAVEDRSYLADKITTSFQDLENKLLDELKGQIASLIGR